MKVSELEGAELDYWVAQAEGHKKIRRVGRTYPVSGTRNIVLVDKWYEPGEGTCDINYCPSTNWSQGGPIIERMGIDVGLVISASGENERKWKATAFGKEYEDSEGDNVISIRHQFGPTPLIAAMRAYVASKFGETVGE